MIAENLGLELVPQQMDWAAEIESTTSGRVDLMLGAMGWTEERSEVMLLTPCRKAVWLVRWTVAPSASGSENGTPISMRSAPPRTSARIHSSERSGVG